MTLLLNNFLLSSPIRHMVKLLLCFGVFLFVFLYLPTTNKVFASLGCWVSVPASTTVGTNYNVVLGGVNFNGGSGGWINLRINGNTVATWNACYGCSYGYSWTPGAAGGVTFDGQGYYTGEICGTVV